MKGTGKRKILAVPISGIDQRELFGQNATYIRQIERAFGVKVVIRGDELRIVGEERSNHEAKQLLTDIIHYLRAGGHLSEQGINYALRMYEKGLKGLELFEEMDDRILVTSRRDIISARTEGQRHYIKAIMNNDLVFVIGPAGTGKTYLAVAMAVRALKMRTVERIVLVRPAVEAEERLGFLPGDMKEKVDPYLRPLYDALYDMMPEAKIERLISQRTIEIAPLAYMRGRTLNNAFIILDEAQNTTYKQMKMFLTRLGFNSMAIITGDITQIDLPSSSDSGLVLVQTVLRDIPGIAFVYLDESDVVRHPLVQAIVKAYERYEASEEE